MRNGSLHTVNKMNSGVHFSSKTIEWETPQSLFDALNEEFGFTLDVCATPENAKCDRFFTKSDNGLLQNWQGCCWMNPPYGSEIGLWIKKAYDSARKGATVVCLVPSRTDTKYWHRFVMRASEVRFIRGRVRFSGKDSAPFPSAIVVFRPTRFSSTVFIGAGQQLELSA